MIVCYLPEWSGEVVYYIVERLVDVHIIGGHRLLVYGISYGRLAPA